MRNLWSAVWKTRKSASHVSKALVGVRNGLRPVCVYSVSGVGIGPDVTVVVRLDESLDRPRPLHGGRDLC